MKEIIMPSDYSSKNADLNEEESLDKNDIEDSEEINLNSKYSNEGDEEDNKRISSSSRVNFTKLTKKEQIARFKNM